MSKLDNDFTEEEDIKIGKFFDEVRNFIKDDFLEEYVAFYIYKLYEYQFPSLYRTPFRHHINSAMENFTSLTYKDIDFIKVKEILKEKYNLIFNEEPFTLQEL